MKTLFVTAALGAALVATPALAQAPGGGRGDRDQTRAEAQQRADFIFQMLDANHDGVVTRAEAEQAVAQFQAQRAANGGAAGGSQGGRGGGMMQRMIDQAFASAPSLTLQQFEGMALARFDAQDLNHDGIVTAAERQQLREQRGQPRPPMAPGAPPAPAVPPPPPAGQ